MDERCMSCGRDTNAGTRLFGARKRGRDRATGSDGFLCHACQPGSAATPDAQSIPLSGRYVVVDLPGGGPGGMGG
jgi:hypothetical protein